MLILCGRFESGAATHLKGLQVQIERSGDLFEYRSAEKVFLTFFFN